MPQTNEAAWDQVIVEVLGRNPSRALLIPAGPEAPRCRLGDANPDDGSDPGRGRHDLRFTLRVQARDHQRGLHLGTGHRELVAGAAGAAATGNITVTYDDATQTFTFSNTLSAGPDPLNWTGIADSSVMADRSLIDLLKC